MNPFLSREEVIGAKYGFRVSVLEAQETGPRGSPELHPRNRCRSSCSHPHPQVRELSPLPTGDVPRWQERPALWLPLFSRDCRNPDACFSAVRLPTGEHQTSGGLPRVNMPALKGMHLAEMGTIEHS